MELVTKYIYLGDWIDNFLYFFCYLLLDSGSLKKSKFVKSITYFHSDATNCSKLKSWISSRHLISILSKIITLHYIYRKLILHKSGPWEGLKIRGCQYYSVGIICNRVNWSTKIWGCHGTLWARIAQNVKKPPLTVNVFDFRFWIFWF